MFDHVPHLPGIYAIVNKVNGYRYVGQATDMNKRTRDHIRKLEAGTHRTSKKRLLQEAWQKFGSSSFEIVVLEIVADNGNATNYHVRPDNLSLAEHYYINERSEYNVDKRIVRDKWRSLLEAMAWRDTTGP